MSPPSGGLSKLFGGFGGGGGSHCVGLSIGSSAIKLVELKREKKGYKLLHFGMIQLPEDVIVNREVVNPVALVDSLKQLMAQLKLKTKNVCASLSGTSLIIKRMQVQAAKIKELQDQVFWEAEQYLPFDVSDVVMDFQTLSRSKDNQTDILLVAVKRSVLDSYMTCIEDAGLKPTIMDADFFALQNVFEANYPLQASESAAIVDIGSAAMKITVVNQGIPVFTKDSTLGGRNLTAEIQKHLGLSFADAETLKAGGGGGSTPQEVVEIMHLMGENYGMEIKRALDFYNASSVAPPVSCVLLAGGGSKVPNLSQEIESKIGLPTQMINPFNAISYDPAVFTQEYVQSIGPIAAVPIGLALRAGAP